MSAASGPPPVPSAFAVKPRIRKSVTHPWLWVCTSDAMTAFGKNPAEAYTLWRAYCN